jgi:hypothetical protein
MIVESKEVKTIKWSLEDFFIEKISNA